jgi:hypothetical protein
MPPFRPSAKYLDIAHHFTIKLNGNRSGQIEAAVDVQDVAGDVGGFVAG